MVKLAAVIALLMSQELDFTWYLIRASLEQKKLLKWGKLAFALPL